MKSYSKDVFYMHIEDFLDKSKIAFEEKVHLSKKTWIKTGGVCTYWITPVSVAQLTEVCRFLYVNNISFDIIGQTSNIYFHPSYNPQVVVSTIRVNSYSIEGDMLICDCGVSVMRLAKACMSAGYAGFYGLIGLPGTVAAAVANNAGCFNCSISSMLIGADVLMPDGTVKTFSKEEFGYGKRSSKFKRGDAKGVVLSVKLKLQKAESIEDEYKKSEKTKQYRKTHQEGYANNLGSIYARKKLRLNFKNLLSLMTGKTAKLLGVSNHVLVKKHTLLWLYGYKDLEQYISDKNINIFVWRDDYSEQAFERYKQFMSEVFKVLEMEIEEKK